MKINITAPKKYTYFKLLRKTKTYMQGDYNKTKAIHIFEGKIKKYYSYIRKGNVQIELIEDDPETINEIKNYLEYLFYRQYIEIKFEGMSNIKLALENVRCFYM